MEQLLLLRQRIFWAATFDPQVAYSTNYTLTYKINVLTFRSLTSYLSALDF